MLGLVCMTSQLRTHMSICTLHGTMPHNAKEHGLQQTPECAFLTIVGDKPQLCTPQEGFLFLDKCKLLKMKISLFLHCYSEACMKLVYHCVGLC